MEGAELSADEIANLAFMIPFYAIFGTCIGIAVGAIVLGLFGIDVRPFFKSRNDDDKE